MHESKPQTTPMVTRQVKNREHKITDEIVEVYSCRAPYREAIASLLYLAGAIRPDISHAVIFLSRKQRLPTDDSIDIKRILRYLRGTSDLGLTFRAKGDKLEAFTDASFRDCEDSTSTSGYIIKLYGDK